MKNFLKILTVVIALLAIGQVMTSKPAAHAEPADHSEPGI